jgi:hypothetical protein
MKRLLWGVVSFALIFALATLTALAYATPPDQTWIGGLYDNADHDDVVLLATSVSATKADSLRPGSALLRMTAIVADSCSPDPSRPSLAVAAPRGPPNS